MSIYLAMSLYSLSMSITPGPVTLITLSSGMGYGMKKTLPFVAGATIGFTLLLLTIGFGLISISEFLPLMLEGIRYVGAGLIAYMGIKIALADPSVKTGGNANIPGFWQGFGLQWLNPKAWIACVAGVAAFELADSAMQLLIFSGLYCFICFFAIGAWAYLGEHIQRFMTNEWRVRIVNRFMGGSLVVLALMLLLK